MTNEQLLEQTKQLIAIESTAHNPKGLREAYAFMVRKLLDSGKEITIEQFESGGKPSFLAYKGKQRPDNFRIIFNVHVDVVPGKPHQYQAEIKDSRLYGRGAHDEKAAAVILADLFCEYVDKVPYALGLQVVTDEEHAGHHGTKYQVSRGVRGDFVICAECGRSSDSHEIVNQAKGIVIADIVFHGQSSHSAYSWRGDNAALKATRFAHALHDRFPVPTEESLSTTVTITNMSASGEAYSRTPGSASVRIDARYTPGDPNFRSRRHFAALIEELDPNADVDIIEFSSPVYTDPQNPLLLSLKAAAEKVEGVPFTLASRHGTSDGRFFGDVGDQACEFGIPGEHQHADGEYIPLQAFDNYRATMREFMKRTLRTEKHNGNTKAFSG